MGTLTDQINGASGSGAVTCRFCLRENTTGAYCKHVRWTFDQGDPIDFARFALETSPYVRARGRKPSEIPEFWWNERGEWVVDHVLELFEAYDGYVFGEIALLDVLARHIWKAYSPDPEPVSTMRIDAL